MTILTLPAVAADTAQLSLANAQIVLPDRVARGGVHICRGHIAAIVEGDEVPAHAIDCGGDYLLPGMVELHTDNLEKHLTPRPGAHWPAVPALLAHDAELVAAGITTALDAVTLGDLEHEGAQHARLVAVIADLTRLRSAGLLRVDHRLHLRCELACPQLLALLAPLENHSLLQLISVMDHTPGQRQYRDLQQYRRYYARAGLSWNDSEFADLLAERALQQQCLRGPQLARVVATAQRRGLLLATHDDTDVAHVAEAVAIGARVAEFPTTLDAARAARAAGLAIVAGAPNLVRGGSHSGNVAVRELAQVDCLDILSSDYVPGSLLQGAFRLHREVGWPLHRAIASVTRTPAQQLGLSDRGEIAVGQHADLLRVQEFADIAVLRAVWVGGSRVF